MVSLSFFYLLRTIWIVNQPFSDLVLDSNFQYEFIATSSGKRVYSLDDNSCVSDCNLYGICSNGFCFCNQGSSGESCEYVTTELTKQKELFALVPVGSYSYFSFNIPCSHSHFHIEVDSTEDNFKEVELTISKQEGFVTMLGKEKGKG